MLTSRYSLVACISSNIRMNFSPLELFDTREESPVQPAQWRLVPILCLLSCHELQSRLVTASY